MPVYPPGCGPPLLLINPWVYDFAAYDFFARPLGLLNLAGVLERQGYQVSILDCLALPHAKGGPWGTGRLPKEVLPPPAALSDVPRRYGRYGISEEAFRQHLTRLPVPVAILVTSLMTYWHPGVAAAIRLAREHFPGAPVILGGIYATLCPDHARAHSGADLVVAGPGENAVIEVLAHLGEGRSHEFITDAGSLRRFQASPIPTNPSINEGETIGNCLASPHLHKGDLGGFKDQQPGNLVKPFSSQAKCISPLMGEGQGGGGANEKENSSGAAPPDLDSLPYPALHLAPHLSFIPLLTSRGCPLACSYCASHLLQPHYQRRQPLAVAGELDYWQHRLNLTDVAFYDDALLVAADQHLLPLLEELARRRFKFRFHTPNGIHARLITGEVARWLKRSDFTTLRLGVETTALGAGRLDRKLAPGELEEALAHLKKAGFARQQLEVYLLLGLPGQDEAEVVASIVRVKNLGATPVLALYSPIPGTALWPEAVRSSRYDLAAEPSCHNNSVFPCLSRFSWEAYTHLKRLAAA